MQINVAVIHGKALHWCPLCHFMAVIKHQPGPPSSRMPYETEPDVHGTGKTETVKVKSEQAEPCVINPPSLHLLA